jgi:hypothetical protein
MKNVRLLLEEIRCRKFQETEKIYILHMAVVLQNHPAIIEKAKANSYVYPRICHEGLPQWDSIHVLGGVYQNTLSPTLRPCQKFILSTEIMIGQTLRSYNVSICMHYLA